MLKYKHFICLLVYSCKWFWWEKLSFCWFISKMLVLSCKLQISPKLKIAWRAFKGGYESISLQTHSLLGSHQRHPLHDTPQAMKRSSSGVRSRWTERGIPEAYDIKVYEIDDVQRMQKRAGAGKPVLGLSRVFFWRLEGSVQRNLWPLHPVTRRQEKTADKGKQPPNTNFLAQLMAWSHALVRVLTRAGAGVFGSVSIEVHRQEYLKVCSAVEVHVATWRDVMKMDRTTVVHVMSASWSILM